MLIISRVTCFHGNQTWLPWLLITMVTCVEGHLGMDEGNCCCMLVSCEALCHAPFP